MHYKQFLRLLPLCFLLLFALPVQAAEQSTPPAQSTQDAPSDQSSLAGQLSGLIKDEGLREVKAIDLNSIGDKALAWGSKSYESLKKGSVPMFVWSMTASVVIMLLGIILGKKVLTTGITGIIISLTVLAIIHFMPEIALTVKQSFQGLLR